MATNVIDPKDFGLKLYNRFPPSYRLDDAYNNYALKRYLEAASDGGFKYVIEEQNGILDLINPQTAPLDVVYYLYEQYGLKLFHGIPEDFLRAFLPNLGTAWSKKGSLSVVEYIVSSLSGIKTSTEVEYDDHDNPVVTVRLQMDYSVSEYFPDTKQFERILENFIPFYCDPYMIYSYVYHDIQDLNGVDSDLMHVKGIRNETGLIPYAAGTRYLPVIGDNGLVLGRTRAVFGEAVFGEALFNEITFNKTFTLAQDPDVLVMDIFSMKYHDIGVHDRVYSTGIAGKYGLSFNEFGEPRQCMIQNGDKFNESAEYNKEGTISDFYYWNYAGKVFNSTLMFNEYLETDQHCDRILLSPYEEIADVEAKDIKQDNLKLSPLLDSARLGHDKTFIFNTSAFNSGSAFSIIEPDTFEDRVIYTYSERGVLTREKSRLYPKPMFNVGEVFNVQEFNEYMDTDYHEDKFSFLPYADKGSVSAKDTETTKVSQAFSDSSTISRYGDLKKLNSAVFGEAIFGEFVFSYEEAADRFKDNISRVSEEQAITKQILNEERSLFNDIGGFNSFQFNGFQNVDLITLRDVRTAVFF